MSYGVVAPVVVVPRVVVLGVVVLGVVVPGVAVLEPSQSFNDLEVNNKFQQNENSNSVDFEIQ